MASDLFQTDGIPNKRCPFCAELIPEPERRCRYCNEYLDPSLRGQYGGGAAHWDGDLLRVPNPGFVRSTHCMVCCGPATTKISKTYNYANRWLLLLLPLAVLPVLILIAVLQRRQEVEVPLCDACRSRWNRASQAMMLFGVLGVLVLPVGLALVGNTLHPRSGDWAGLGALAGFLVWGWGLFAIWTFRVRRHQVVCKRIDHRGALLRVPNASLLQTSWEEDK